MTDFIAISKKEHKSFRFSKPTNWAFAKKENICKICLAEIKQIAEKQVIVFLEEKKDTFGLYTIQGFEKTNNLYVTDDGGWLSNYVPAYYRCNLLTFNG